MNDLHEMSSRARNAFLELSVAPLSSRNEVLTRMADLLYASSDEIFAANKEDLLLAEKEGLSSPLLHRLKFGPDKLKQEITPLLRSGDFFKKIVVSAGNSKPHMDENGIYHMGVIPFLLNPDSIDA